MDTNTEGANRKGSKRSDDHRKSGVEKPRRQPIPTQEASQNKPNTWPLHEASRQINPGAAQPPSRLHRPGRITHHPESRTRVLHVIKTAKIPGGCTAAKPAPQTRTNDSSPQVTDSGAARRRQKKPGSYDPDEQFITPSHGLGGCASSKQQKSYPGAAQPPSRLRRPGRSSTSPRASSRRRQQTQNEEKQKKSTPLATQASPKFGG